MSTLLRYVLHNTNDEPVDSHLYTHYQEAVENARRRSADGEPTAVIEYTYTYDDSELVWAPDNAEVWPPR